MYGRVNGAAAGAQAAVDAEAETYAYDKASRTVAPAAKSHSHLADIDRALGAATEMVRQYRARVSNVTDLLVGEVNTLQEKDAPVPPPPVNGQIGAIMTTVQYLGYALQDLQSAVTRLENSVGA
jgi:hypothetical protein